MSLTIKKNHLFKIDQKFNQITETLEILEYNSQILSIRLALANLSNSEFHKNKAEDKYLDLYKKAETLLNKLGEFKSFSTDAVAKRIEKLRKEILKKL